NTIFSRDWSSDVCSSDLFEKVGDAAGKMIGFAANDENRLSVENVSANSAAFSRLVDDAVWSAAQRELDLRSHESVHGELPILVFQPSLMTRQEMLHLAGSDPRRGGHPQATATRDNAQGKPARARIYDHLKRHSPTCNFVSVLGCVG